MGARRRKEPALILVSFHGGHGGDDDGATSANVTPYNNLRAYDDDGNEFNPKGQVLQGQTVEISELRGICVVPNGYLWVASGAKGASAILSYKQTAPAPGPVWTYQNTVMEFAYPTSPLLHPFDFAFDDQGYCYVSNQDTDVVARLEGMAPCYTSASTAPWPASLQKVPNGKFLDGTFVACSVGKLPDKHIAHTTAVPEDAGLGITIQGVKGKCKVTNSVRGVIWLNGYLYVADEVAGYIKMYARDGTYQNKSTYKGNSRPLPDPPVHLMYHSASECLCVSSGDSILYAPVADAPTTLDFNEVPNLPSDLTSVAGMTLSPAGNLYVGSRTGLKCWQLDDFSPQTGPAGNQTAWPVTDNPEFLLYVLDASEPR